MNHGKPWKQDAWLQANNMWELILVTAGGRGHGSRGLCGLCWLRWLTTWRILSFCLFSRNVTYPIPRQFDTKCWECPCTGRPTMYRQTNDVPADQQCTGRPTTIFSPIIIYIDIPNEPAGCFRQLVVSGSGLFPGRSCVSHIENNSKNRPLLLNITIWLRHGGNDKPVPGFLWFKALCTTR